MEQSENGILLPGDTDVDALDLVGDASAENADNRWQAHNVTEEPRGRIFTSVATGTTVGQLHNIGASSMKATCKCHTRFSTVFPPCLILIDCCRA